MVDFSLHHETISPETSQTDSPCIILLHGRGADEQDLLGLSSHFPDALQIISLQAPDRLGPGYTWYELDLSGGGLHESQPDREDFQRSLTLLDNFRTEAIDAYDIDPNQIGLLGFSQGGILGFASILDYPDKYAYCIGLHSYLPASYQHNEKTEGIQGFPIFIGAGTADDIIPVSRAETAAEYFKKWNADITFNTYNTGHGIGSEELADVTDWLTTHYR
ncbi:MAG: alpha/beta hydrolase [Halobacteriaceae archaeon]